MRERISMAAASVKVTTSSWLTLQRGWASQIRCTQRCARTEVFPDPAAAETSRLLPLAVIASSCCGVQDLLEVELLMLLLDQLCQQILALRRWDVAVAVDGGIEAANRLVLAVGAGAHRAHAIGADGDIAGDDLVGEARQLAADFAQQRGKLGRLRHISAVSAAKLAVFVDLHHDHVGASAVT